MSDLCEIPSDKSSAQVSVTRRACVSVLQRTAGILVADQTHTTCSIERLERKQQIQEVVKYQVSEQNRNVKGEDRLFYVLEYCC